MKINLKGIIVSNNDLEIYQWFGIEAVSPKMITEQLVLANGEDIEVYINSPGGSVWAGSEIHAALKEYAGNSVSKIVGMAASAASFAAMGTKKVMIAPTGQLMIHNASGSQDGDHRDMQHKAEYLKQVNDSIANAYILKSGLPRAELLGMMDKETFFTAQEALEKNLVDEIMFDVDNQLKLVASIGSAYTLPQAVVDKTRNELLKNKIPPIDEAPASAEGDDLLKDLNELKEKHPAIYQAAVNEGETQERARLKSIDDISATIASDLVVKAKYETPVTAENLAFQALKADAGKGFTFANNRTEELDPANQVPAAEALTKAATEAAEMNAATDKIAAAANLKRQSKEGNK